MGRVLNQIDVLDYVFPIFGEAKEDPPGHLSVKTANVFGTAFHLGKGLFARDFGSIPMQLHHGSLERCAEIFD